MRLFLAAAAALLLQGTAMAAEPTWSLMIHGGAGTITRAEMTPERDRRIRATLNAALDAGGAVLKGGGSSVDAVEAAVRVLEDSPDFNAGKGAALTSSGTAELDAAIMDGATQKAGAVAGIGATKNPVRAARAVMERTPHVLLVGAAGDRVAKEAGAEQVPNSYFVTGERREMLRQMQAEGKNAEQMFDVRLRFGTVGAVARDAEGNLAAATSTGGLTGKMPGRVGDAPLIGAGTVADNRACAVSATGSGEMFIRARVAGQICDRIRFASAAPTAAAEAALAEVKSLGGDGGVIVMPVRGEPAWSFNSQGMYRGILDSAGKRQVAIHGDE